LSFCFGGEGKGRGEGLYSSGGRKHSSTHTEREKRLISCKGGEKGVGISKEEASTLRKSG